MVNQFRVLIRQKVNFPKILSEVLPVQQAELPHRGGRQEPEWVPEKKAGKDRRWGNKLIVGNKLFQQLSSLVVHYKPAQ